MLRNVILLGGVSVLLISAQSVSNPCKTCHPSETARFLASPMGRSLGPADAIPPGRTTHSPSASTLTADFRKGQLFHTLSERGITAEYPVAFQIGRGVKARTYAVRVGDYLLESPLTWYKSGGWDVSPGYEAMQLLDFDRPVTENCLFCHAGRAKADDADGRKIPIASVTAITCDRCHGSTTAHLARPSATNIVNPAKLTGAARDSVCEQCHLEGETRVNNPGKTQWDYRPGDTLEATIATYLLHDPSEKGRKAVTQVEEFAESKCAKSGKLWCGSCHSPHPNSSNSAANRATKVAQVCTGCHAQPTLSKTVHTAKATDCAACHMPARSTSNVAHLAVTDHQLRRPGAPPAPPVPGPPGIKPWRQPPPEFRLRNMALAALQLAAERNLPALAAQATRLVESLPAQQQTNDPEVLAALEVLYLGTSSPEKAVQLSQWAVDSAPNSATFAMNHGLALMRAKNLPAAEREFLRALTLDPSLMQAAAQLAILYDRQGRKADSQAAIARFLKWNPQSIQFRLSGGQERPAPKAFLESIPHRLTLADMGRRTRD